MEYHNSQRVMEKLGMTYDHDAEYVMGYPDDLKLRSCMTLFQAANPESRTFQAVLDKFFSRKPDEKPVFFIYTHGAPKGDFLKGIRAVTQKKNCIEGGLWKNEA